MHWYEVEREALAHTLLELGPDVPTVCEGWQTRHLATHLYLRQNHPLKAAGAFIPVLADRTELTIQTIGDSHTGDESYAALVGRFLAGAGRFSPMRLGGDAVNLVEYVIHHEDARRGAGPVPPRARAPQIDAAVRRGVKFMARRAYRADGDGVVLQTPDGHEVYRRKGAAPVLVTGEPVELILHASGRERVADVEVAGTTAARDRFLARHR